MNIPALGEMRLFVVVQAVRDLTNGGSNALGTFTLAASATSTVVSDPNCLPTSRPAPVPTSATAAASGWFVQAVAKGSFTIGHASSAATDKTFSYELRKA